VYFARLAQRLITALTAMTAEGGLYEVDMRLRPSGNKGPVAVSFETFQNYQHNEAWTWEQLALTRARVLGRRSDLKARVEVVIRDCLMQERDKHKVLADVASMRARLDRERPARSPWDLKEAKGGLFDIEFIVQGLQLVHAARMGHVLRPNTLEALDALRASELLSQQDADALSSSLLAYQKLVQVLRLTVGEVFTLGELSISLQALIAETLGLAAFETVEPTLVEHEQQVRDIFDRVIGGAAS
jgi:glutamate-ammonia-ligase adenylyltransferase